MSRTVEYVARFGIDEDGADVDGLKNKREADKIIKEAILDPNVGTIDGDYVISIYKLWTYPDGEVDEELYFEHPLLQEYFDGRMVIPLNVDRFEWIRKYGYPEDDEE
tara:strand:+ start:17 stop:337 length:321 start_codon:yes stop_codon:yes gene_type:complete